MSKIINSEKIKKSGNYHFNNIGNNFERVVDSTLKSKLPKVPTLFIPYGATEDSSVL